MQPTLYPKRHPLPSAYAFSLITCVCLFASACEQDDAQQTTQLPAEPWPHEYEAVFQEAEVLKYTLAEQRLETQRQLELQSAVVEPPPGDTPPQ